MNPGVAYDICLVYLRTFGYLFALFGKKGTGRIQIALNCSRKFNALCR